MKELEVRQPLKDSEWKEEAAEGKTVANYFFNANEHLKVVEPV